MRAGAAGACALLMVGTGPALAGELVGFAVLPADTFAEGPPAGADNGSGEPISGAGRTGPFPGQPVQGFSAVQFAPDGRGAYWFMPDNGFGNKQNSSDYLQRIYQLRPNFRTAHRFTRKGDASVAIEGFVQLSDPYGYIPFPIVNEQSRLLTGSDFDIESFVIDRKGDIWVGEEFGPFVLHFDKRGRLLEAPIATPDIDADGRLTDDEVVSPNNPTLADPNAFNLRGSRGFEGMAFSPNRRKLYPMLEGTVVGDPDKSLRIYEMNARRGTFTRFIGFYGLEPEGTAIGDFTPINRHEFLVIERDGTHGQRETGAIFKRVFKIDIRKLDPDGFVEKEEVVDLLDLADPNDLNDDGNTTFDFPFQTIEDVLVLDRWTILVANDNNYPDTKGRPDEEIVNNEIIVIELDRPLRLSRKLGEPRFDDDDDDDGGRGYRKYFDRYDYFKRAYRKYERRYGYRYNYRYDD